MLGQPLKDIKLPGNVLVVATRRDGTTSIPDGAHEFQEDDEVYALGKPSTVEEFEAWVGTHRGRPRNVVIFGASRVAFHTARTLERHNIKIRLLADDREASRRLADSLSNTMVLDVDGIDTQAFKEEHVGKADVFVGASDVDERNLLSCQIAGKLGCPRTIALVSSSAYIDIYEEIGIDRAVSPRLLCSDAIMARVQAGKLRMLAMFDEGAAKVCHVRLAAGAALVGRQLCDAGFPKGCVVGAVQRGENATAEVLIPRGDQELREDDDLILFMLSAVEQRVFDLVEARG
jgi:trk system potassium uptake protein TrkA